MPVRAKMKVGLGHMARRVIPFPLPEEVTGHGCSGEMAAVAEKLKITKVLLVTDAMLAKLGLIDACVKSLEEGGITVSLFDKVTPDPTVDTCKEGLDMYMENGCNGLIAFGGGSPMDAAKMIGLMSTRPKKDPVKLMGMLPLWSSPFGGKMPPLIAVPTTAGTGSEATIASVITFPKLKKKYTVIDPALCPKVAVMDPLLLKNLPKHITAATGLDALTHAVESYLGKYMSSFTGKRSIQATEEVFKHLEICFNTPGNLESRQAMLEASYQAGVAFTRANVGYVHAIAHQLGALYHTPHGVANAMVLAEILDFYKDVRASRMADLAVAAGLAEKKNGDKTNAELAQMFVDEVKRLRTALEVPTYVKGLSQSGVREIAKRALNEAHGSTWSATSAPLQYAFDIGYPVPKYMNLKKCAEIVERLVDPSTKEAVLDHSI